MNIVAFIIYTGFVTYASLRPMDGVSIGNWDKIGHLTLYFVFAVIGYRMVSKPKHYLFLCIGIVVYGGLMELAQSYMPGRMMSAYDVLANTAGVVIAMVFTKMLFSAKSL
jgi:VanZ family protein